MELLYLSFCVLLYFKSVYTALVHDARRSRSGVGVEWVGLLGGKVAQGWPKKLLC